jgi:DNA polymerase-4
VGTGFGAPGDEPAQGPPGAPPRQQDEPVDGMQHSDAGILAVPPPPALPARSWRPGQDVSHREHGAGWVWGSGRGLVTVRFEGPTTTPGPVRTFGVDDPDLQPSDPPFRPPADVAGA